MDSFMLIWFQYMKFSKENLNKKNFYFNFVKNKNNT